MKSERARRGLALVGLWAVAAGGSGCLSTNRQMLDEVATIFHDDLRWGRLMSAEGVVDGRMRRAFAEHHRGWGTAVHVIDVELEHFRQGSSRGIARLRVSWTRGFDATDLRESVVEEQWVNDQGNWRLRNESVIAGDAGLFGTPTGEGATPRQGAEARADMTERTRQ
ncbi:MAG: hypothetical protein R3A52_00725 [Polyangiales bacterium]